MNQAQALYDELKKAKEKLRIITEAIKHDQEAFAPLEMARETLRSAQEDVKAELDQWKAANEAVLKNQKEARAEVKTAKAYLDEALVTATIRGEQLQLFDDKREVQVTLQSKLRLSDAGSTAEAEEGRVDA